MTNVTTLPTKAAASPPVLPASLRRALADFTTQYGLPVGSKPPPAADARAGIAILEKALEPTSKTHASQCLAKLAVAANLQQTKEEARLRLEVWWEANGDVPADLWESGTRALLQEYQFGMPKPSNFRDHVAIELEQRQGQLRNSRILLEMAHRKPDGAEFERDPWDVRVKTMRDSFRSIGNIAKASHYERQLAEHEKRQPEEWAREPA